MRKPFVVISGIPGGGKTTLGRRLAPVLNLPFIDKDDILDRLCEAKGVGNAAWRRALSRESDVILEREATRSDGAILESFWRMPGMPSDSGTPTDWLHAPSHLIVNVHCLCGPRLRRTVFFKGADIPGTSMASRPPRTLSLVFANSLNTRRSTSAIESTSTRPTSRTS